MNFVAVIKLVNINKLQFENNEIQKWNKSKHKMQCFRSLEINQQTNILTHYWLMETIGIKEKYPMSSASISR